jgi:hypothetical protein
MAAAPASLKSTGIPINAPALLDDVDDEQLGVCFEEDTGSYVCASQIGKETTSGTITKACRIVLSLQERGGV